MTDISSAKIFIDKALSGPIGVLKTVNKKISSNRLYFIAIFLIPTMLYFPYYLTSSKIGLVNGDFDYFLQNYEAVRRSIVEFHQFPWWNPWSGGGLPLYANPQIGVFSIPSFFAILFGTVLGLKLSVILFMIAGQAGLYLLVRSQFKTSKLESVLLSFLWVLNGFFTAHLPAHFSFIYYWLLPLLLYVQLQLSKTKSRLWIAYAFLWTLCILGAIHYALIQMGVMLFVVLLIQLKNSIKSYGFNINRNCLIRNLVKTALLVLVFTSHRILYTLQYVKQFPRDISETTNSTLLLLKGLALPNAQTNLPQLKSFSGLTFGAVEYASSVGMVVTLFLIGLAATFILRLMRSVWLGRTISVKSKNFLAAGLVIGFTVFFLISMGPFDSLSPYNILKHLPIFSGMQVASRWLLFSAFVAIVGLGYLMRNGRISTFSNISRMVILFSVIELAILTVGQDRNKFFRYANDVATVVVFDQRVAYLPPDYNINDNNKNEDAPPHDSKYDTFAYEATVNNIGLLQGYEPLYDTRVNTQGRCSALEPCRLIASGNGVLSSWSPNKLIIKRSASGNIRLNMMPSSLWLVNGVRIYDSSKILNPGQFEISDTADTFVIELKPRSPQRLIGHKIKNRIDR